MEDERETAVPFGVSFEERKPDNLPSESEAETDTYRKDTEDGDA
jgi:hypothetical protein